MGVALSSGDVLCVFFLGGGGGSLVDSLRSDVLVDSPEMFWGIVLVSISGNSPSKFAPVTRGWMGCFVGFFREGQMSSLVSSYPP